MTLSTHSHRLQRWLMLLTGSLILGLLLSACDIFGSSSSATPTPTKAANTGTTALTTYTGDGYTIGYPQGWTAKSHGKGPTNTGKSVILTDSTGLATLTINEVENPYGSAPTSLLLDATVAAFKIGASNYQETQIAAQTTVGGQSWDQRSGTADVTVQGTKGNVKFVALGANYPAHTKQTRLYTILYAAPTLTFDTFNASAFQPMLQSFTFTV